MNSRASFIAVMVLVFLTFNASCESSGGEKGPVTDVADGHSIVNAIVANPDIGETLRNDGLAIGRMTRQVIQPGVTEYTLYAHTCAMCDPGRAKTVIVAITEDERPTYSDGPIKYSVSFSTLGKPGDIPDPADDRGP